MVDELNLLNTQADIYYEASRFQTVKYYLMHRHTDEENRGGNSETDSSTTETCYVIKVSSQITGEKMDFFKTGVWETG